MVKRYACQSVTLLVDYSLHTNGFVLVHIQVKDVNFPIIGYSSKHSARIWGPFHISYCTSQVKHKKWVTGRGKQNFCTWRVRKMNDGKSFFFFLPFFIKYFILYISSVTKFRLFAREVLVLIHRLSKQLHEGYCSRLMFMN